MSRGQLTNKTKREDRREDRLEVKPSPPTTTSGRGLTSISPNTARGDTNIKKPNELHQQGGPALDKLSTSCGFGDIADTLIIELSVD